MFKRHENEVNSVAFSPDGRHLVSGSDDRSVCIWNIRDGSSKLLPTTTDLGFFVSVVFSPDGRYIAAGDLGKWIRIWTSRTRKLVAKWKAHEDCVWCVEFTPDGKGLMSGSTDHTLKCWDVSSLGNYQAEENELVTLPLIRSFSGHTVSLGSPLRSHGWRRHFRTVFALLLFPPVTVNGLSPVQTIAVCAYGILELGFGNYGCRGIRRVFKPWPLVKGRISWQLLVLTALLRSGTMKCFKIRKFHELLAVVVFWRENMLTKRIAFIK